MHVCVYIYIYTYVKRTLCLSLYIYIFIYKFLGRERYWPTCHILNITVSVLFCFELCWANPSTITTPDSQASRRKESCHPKPARGIRAKENPRLSKREKR